MKRISSLCSLLVIAGVLFWMPQAYASKKGKKHSESATSSSSKSHKNNKNSWDYVIVGAGTAGATLAAKLSDPDANGKFKNSVLVLEAGVNLSDSPLVLVNNIIGAEINSTNPILSTVDLTYYLEGNPFAVFNYTEGRMWGGSSGHNFLLCVRGVPSVYDEWAAISGDPRWSYNQLLNNVMIPMEHYTPDGTTADPSQRGLNGPLFITQMPPQDTDPFMQAVSAATGAPITSDYNDPVTSLGEVAVSAPQQYVTPPFLGPDSHRSFAANAYLTGDASVGTPPIVDANGNGLNGRKLKIVSNARANRVLFTKKNKASGVEYVVSPDRETANIVKAKKGVILCTGTFEDAAILQRSGIGDPALLSPLGIPVVFANPNVGANMQNHVAQIGIIGGGAMTTIDLPAYGLAFYGFSPDTSTREYQSIVANTVAFLPGGIAQALGITEGITVDGVNIAPKSTGTVAIVSRDPFVQPLINFNAFSDGTISDPGSDANKVVLFYNLLQDIADAYNALPLPPHAPAEVLFPPPADYTAGPDALFADGLNTIGVNNHACGTCRMSQTPLTGVVDGELNVFGVKNLKVASNSVVPVINTGNTSYTADVIGREAARIIRGS